MDQLTSYLRCLLALGVVGCGAAAATAPDPTPESLLALQPSCDQPAPLYGEPDPNTPGYIVGFRDGVKSEVETPRLAALYDFQPSFTYTTALQGFAAELTPETVAELRCVSTIKSIEHDASVGPVEDTVRTR